MIGRVQPTVNEALRTDTALYVEYADGDREYHDLVADPYELHNSFAALTAGRKSALHAAMAAMQTRRGPESCWAAQHPKFAEHSRTQR
jgi:hypothetical protein